MVSKSERRRQLREQKELKRLEKKPLEVKKILAPKIPSSSAAPVVVKKPVYTHGMPRYPFQMTHDFALEDREGAWSWENGNRDWHATVGEAHVRDYLDAYMTKTWQEIQQENVVKAGGKNERRNKHYPLSAIKTEAYNRLVSLNLDDRDEIFRFRMTNLERIYGFITGINFQTVWYDANHEICK